MNAEPSTSIPIDQALHHTRRVLETVMGIPATEGNAIEIYRNGDQIFAPMLDAISSANRSIDFLTFVYWKGEIGIKFAERFAERARAGVRVRVLLDSWGAQTIERTLLDLMKDSGVNIQWFRPLRRLRPREVNHRTHRKILVVDERVGFTGGVGIADAWLGDARSESEWRDTHFRIEGPAVDGIRSAFIDNWSEADSHDFEGEVDQFPDQAQPGTTTLQCVRGNASSNGSDLKRLFQTMLQLAQHRVRITTAYFVPDEELCRLLCDGARRGVEIQLLLPGPFADKRFVQLEGDAEYERLMEAGVEIWNFQPSMLHAKIMTIDGMVASVGSANFNFRSLDCDEELNLVVFDTSFASDLDRHFDEDLERSVRIDPARWKQRSLTERSLERVVAPLRRFS